MRQTAEFAEVLDTALARLARGESVQVCLSSYPELADELEPLLVLAQEMLLLSTGRPDPTARLATRRAAFLRLVARAQRAHRVAKFRSRLRHATRETTNALAQFIRRRAAIAALSVALTAALLAGTSMITSASSLPGDPLYPVKRAAEAVQLALTFDKEARASMEQSIQQRRIEETRALLEMRKQTEVTFRGTVESFDGSTLIAAGLTVHILPATRMVGAQPAPGRIVVVVALTRHDNGLAARSITTLEPTRVPVQPTHQPTRTVVVALLGTATVTSTIWTEPAATVELPSDQTAEPPPALSATPALTATPTSSATLTPSATLLPSPVLTATPVFTPSPLTFEGVIEAIDGAQWIVGGRAITVTPLTAIAGEPRVGRLAEVQAEALTDGKLQAIAIRIKELVQPSPTASVTAQPSASPTSTLTPGAGPTATPTPDGTATATPTLPASVTPTLAITVTLCSPTATLTPTR